MTQFGQQPHTALQPQYVPMNSNTPTTTLYSASGTPVQIINVNPNNGKYSNYENRAARILGILQIVCGVIIVFAQVIVTSFQSPGYQGMSGFWAPVLFILAGAFGIQSSKTKSRGVVITTMVLSIISAVFSMGPIFQGSSGINFSVWWAIYYNGACETDSCYHAMIAFHSIMVIFGFMEGIVAIVAAAYCCHGCCCHSQPGVILTPGGSVMTTVTSQQGGAYYPAPASVGSYPPAAGDLSLYNDQAPPPQYKEKI